MSEGINKNYGNDSDESEMDIFIIDNLYGKKYTVDISENATVKDLVKEVRGLELKCFKAKNKEYFLIRKCEKVITNSENIKKTMADLNIEQGDCLSVSVYEKAEEKDQDGLIEIKKLETEKENEQTGEAANKKIKEITVYVKDLVSEKVELKLKPEATFEDLLIELKKADGTENMEIAPYFELIFNGKVLNKMLKDKNLKQVKISDLNINDNSMLTFVVCLGDRGECNFSWADIKSVDEKDLTDGWRRKSNQKGIIIKTPGVDPLYEIGKKEQKSANTNMDNLKTENQTSMFNKQENTEKPKLPLVNINDASIKKSNKQAATQAKKKPEVTEESKSKESLISRIIRKIKSFFSWLLYKIFFRKRDPQTEKITSPQTSIKNKIQLGKNNKVVPRASNPGNNEKIL